MDDQATYPYDSNNNDAQAKTEAEAAFLRSRRLKKKLVLRLRSGRRDQRFTLNFIKTRRAS